MYATVASVGSLGGRCIVSHVSQVRFGDVQLQGVWELRAYDSSQRAEVMPPRIHGCGSKWCDDKGVLRLCSQRGIAAKTLTAW